MSYILSNIKDTAFIFSTTDGDRHWNLTGVFTYLNKLKIFSNLNGFAFGGNERLLTLGTGYPLATPHYT